jgi:uncharacterized 2Fe-2S/4Fe-4S cluster protein (DUF4445 family)
MLKHNVTFHPSERKILVDEEENLLQAAMEAGIHINASCGGSATCGKCKVKILKGVVDSSKHPKLTQKAIFIGLLPEIDIEKFIFVGNGSLLGARLLSFSKNLLKETERIALMMTNLELSNHPTFMTEFIAAMFLPHTDSSAFPHVMQRLHGIRREFQRERMVEERL